MMNKVRPQCHCGRITTAVLLALTAISAGGLQAGPPADTRPPQNSATRPSPGTAESPKSQPGTKRSGKEAEQRPDACALLTSAEIAAVQGEPVRETRPTEQSAGALRLLQCFYVTPTLSKSVSLALAVRGSGIGPREYWNERFHAAERDSEATPASTEEAEPGSKRGPPVKIAGIGDEAFWVGNRFTSVLYVLSGDRFLRVSVGGDGSQEMKLSKSKQLAGHALRRLQVPAQPGNRPDNRNQGNGGF
jgi:hypothetical protein